MKENALLEKVTKLGNEKLENVLLEVEKVQEEKVQELTEQLTKLKTKYKDIKNNLIKKNQARLDLLASSLKQKQVEKYKIDLIHKEITQAFNKYKEDKKSWKKTLRQKLLDTTKIFTDEDQDIIFYADKDIETVKNFLNEQFKDRTYIVTARSGLGVGFQMESKTHFIDNSEQELLQSVRSKLLMVLLTKFNKGEK